MAQVRFIIDNFISRKNGFYNSSGIHIYLYSIFVGYSVFRDNEISKKKFNARRRFTPKEDAVLHVLEQMEIPGRVHPNQPNVLDFSPCQIVR